MGKFIKLENDNANAVYVLKEDIVKVDVEEVCEVEDDDGNETIEETVYVYTTNDDEPFVMTGPVGTAESIVQAIEEA